MSEELDEFAELKKAVREHVDAWGLYFAETGAKPEELWTTFAKLKELIRKERDEKTAVIG